MVDVSQAPITRHDDAGIVMPLPALSGDEALLDFLLAQAGRAPLLSAEAEQCLARRVQAGDETAKCHFIEANLRLVMHIAKDYQGAGLPLEDLFQEGCLGLMRAVEHFDSDKGTRFSTYAIYWIRQNIIRALGNGARTIRLPIYVYDQLRQVERAIDAYYQAYGREPTLESLAHDTGFAAERLLHLSTLDQRPVSLQRPAPGTEEAMLAETIADTNSAPVDEMVTEHSQQEALSTLIAQALPCLTRREQQVLTLCYGLDEGGDARDGAEVGRVLGLSRERVRQLHKSALTKLRRPERVPMLHAFVAEHVTS